MPQLRWRNGNKRFSSPGRTESATSNSNRIILIKALNLAATSFNWLLQFSVVSKCQKSGFEAQKPKTD
jgi:hypothetical protein